MILYHKSMIKIAETYKPIFQPDGLTFIEAGRLSGITTVLALRALATPACARIVTNIPFDTISHMATQLGLTPAKADKTLIVQPTMSVISRYMRPLIPCDLLILDDAQNLTMPQLQHAINHVGDARAIIAWHPDTGYQETIMFLHRQNHLKSTWKDNREHLNPITIQDLENPHDTLAELFPSLER